jgi:alanine-glyoxylate transaminase/serine-glyoxylate transaminase/serine-pyruvate transaminase
MRMKKNLLESIHPTLLMGPGPSCVSPSTYHAMSLPTLGHLDPYFIDIMDGIKAGLRQLMGTSNEVTVPLSGTGSAGMEAAFVNTVEAGDKVLVLINGVFGVRMADVAGRLGAVVDTVEAQWGTALSVSAVKAKLDANHYDIVAVVHAETSTGVLNPVAEIGKLVKAQGALFIVDTVTSLGGIPVKVDEWGADVCYSGSQKCLSCPPGVAPITFSPTAMAKINARKNKVPNWYLDMTLLTQYWGGSKRVYHHTAPINMMYGAYQAIYQILEEGLEAVWQRHQETHEYLVESLDKIGIQFLVSESDRLPMLNAVLVPEGVDEAAIRTRLLKEFHIEIGAGLGPLAGKIWRIGLMGHTAHKHNVDRLVAALKACL